MHGSPDLPVEIRPDRTLRVKVIDACGMACTFCHNEGTPVTADNHGRTAGEFTGTPGPTGRVSIYLRTNGADFLPARRTGDGIARSDVGPIGPLALPAEGDLSVMVRPHTATTRRGRAEHLRETATPVPNSADWSRACDEY